MRNYFTGIIFVIDSADRERIQEAKEELFRILDTQEMKGVPLVVINNKQDLPGKAIKTMKCQSYSLKRKLTASAKKLRLMSACAVRAG